MTRRSGCITIATYAAPGLTPATLTLRAGAFSRVTIAPGVTMAGCLAVRVMSRIAIIQERGMIKMLHETSAREALAEMRQGRTIAEYIELVWASRYPHSMPAASGGWPYTASAGLVEMPSKVRKIK